LTIPHRGTTSDSTYFVTTNVFAKKSMFQVEKIALLFMEVMLDYRAEGKYSIHEFVVMPDHFHLIVSPIGITLERAMQFINGGFSFRFNRNLKFKREVWQGSYFDRRVRDSLEYQKYKDYIWQNPVLRGLAKAPEEYPYSSANPSFVMDPVPQRLKPIASSGWAAGLKACSTPRVQTVRW
jgi:putative transposase